MSEHVQRGAALLEAGRASEALQVIGPHLAHNPDDTAALYVASAALMALGRGPEALDAAVRVVRLEPDRSESWHTLAFAQLQARDLQNAVASASRAMQLSPGDWATHANLALIAGEHDPTGPLALQEAQEAVRLAPNASEAHHAVGLALLRGKKPKAATVAFETALRLDPQNKLARHNLAVASVRTGNPARAVVDLAGLTAQSPNDPLTLSNLRVAIGNTLGQIHSVIFAAALISVQLLRTIVRDMPTEWAPQFWLSGVAVLALAVIAVLVLRTRRILGASLPRIFRFVVSRDRLIAAWAIVDAVALLPLVISPFLPQAIWPLSYSLGWAFVFTGLIIRVIRGRGLRSDSKR